jgi:GGDEF domain-containing protein
VDGPEGLKASLLRARGVQIMAADFNELELDSLERRENHLSILAAVMLLVMAAGVALLMYPLVFEHPDEENKWPMRIAYVGFCVLSLLFVAYLLSRRRTMGRLKQQLVSELKRNLDLRYQGNVDLLHTIPDLNQFRDRLSMEFRRASSMERTLSLLVVKVKLAAGLPDAEEKSGLGEAARVISRNLRPGDTMYLFGPGLFGAVMPDTDTASANRIALKLDETLRFMGSKNKLAFETTVRNYPENTKSAYELEEMVSSLILEKQPWESVDAQ